LTSVCPKDLRRIIEELGAEVEVLSACREAELLVLPLRKLWSIGADRVSAHKGADAGRPAQHRSHSTAKLRNTAGVPFWAQIRGRDRAKRPGLPSAEYGSIFPADSGAPR